MDARAERSPWTQSGEAARLTPSGDRPDGRSPKPTIAEHHALTSSPQHPSLRFRDTPPMDPLAPRKRELRAAVRATLAAADLAAMHARSIAACDHAARAPGFEEASVVLAYLAIPGTPEVDPSSLVARAVAAGKRVCLPRIGWEDGSMEAWEVTTVIGSGTDQGVPVEVRQHGVPEPAEGSPVSPGEIDLVIVPGLAFDAAGGRLGRGGGFYDRFLARVADRADSRNAPPRKPAAGVIGLCLDEQVVDEIPMGPADHGVDAIATDRRLIIASSG